MSSVGTTPYATVQQGLGAERGQLLSLANGDETDNSVRSFLLQMLILRIVP